jgi:hypothetical protein
MRCAPRLPAITLTLACLALAHPAAASCADERWIHARDIRTPGVTQCDVDIYCWDGSVVLGCLDRSVSADFSGSFWALGTGDPALGQGDDNGLLPAADWSYDPSPCVGGGMPGYENARWPRVISGTWSAPGIDGCVDAAGTYAELTGDECMLVALSDQSDGQSYFALLSALVNLDEFEDPLFWPWRDLGPIELAELPSPEISQLLEGPPSGGRCEVVVTAPSPAAIAGGLYLDGGCATDLVQGYNVYRSMSKSGSPPDDLSLEADWDLLTSTPIPLGESATLAIVGGASGRIYLAGSLVFESGFETDRVSPPAGPVTCPRPGS